MKQSVLILAVFPAILFGAERPPQPLDPVKVIVDAERMILPLGLQPYMFQSANGTLVLQAQVSRKIAYPGVWKTVRSTDHGQSWHSWSPAKGQGEGPFTEGNVAQGKDGKILVLEWLARGPDSNGYFTGNIWESRDYWLSLEGPYPAKMYVPEGKAGVDDGGDAISGIFLHRTLVEMPNGDWLTTAYGWFKEDSTPSTYQPKMNKTRTLLLRSRDRGRNWTLVSTIAVGPTVGEEGFDEPVLLRLTQGPRSGRFIVLMRTGRVTPIYQTESDDEGKTWTKAHPLGFNGVNPDLIEMKSGLLVAGFGWRTIAESERKIVPRHEYKKDPKAKAVEESRARKPSVNPNQGNYLAFSLDQGSTWAQVTKVTTGRNGDYVTVREVQPDNLLLVYNNEAKEAVGRFIKVLR